MRLLLLTALALATVGQGAGPGPRVEFAGGRVSFVAPAGFTALTPKEIAIKFPRPAPPKAVVGSPSRTTTIAYDYLEPPFTVKDLEPARKLFTNQFDSMFYKLKWIANDVRRMGDRDFVYFEFTEASFDIEFRHMMLLTVL